MSKYFWGVVCVLLGAFLFATKAIMVKLAYLSGVDHLSLLMLRMLFSLPIYLIILLTTSRPKRWGTEIAYSDIMWVFWFGILGYYIASYFDFFGLAYISAGLERVILFIYPTLVLIINRIWLKQPINRIQVVAILMTYLGVAVASLYDENVSNNKDLLVGTVLILISSITFAGYIVGSGWLIPKLGSKVFTCYAMIFACIMVISHYLFVKGFNLPIWNVDVYSYALLMAIFATVVPSFMVSYGIKQIGSSNASIIASVGPIFTIVLAILILNEKINSEQIVGTLLVIGGVLFLSIFGNKRQKSV
jgi:drug/metabolite transporter (DMT)-like permease